MTAGSSHSDTRSGRPLRICILGLGGGGFHWEAQRIIAAVQRPLELILIYAGPGGGLNYWKTNDPIVSRYVVRSPSLMGDTAARKALGLVANFFHALRILHTERPDITLAVGTAQAIPFSLAAFLLHREFWYAESITRMRSPSRTTRLMYRLRFAARIYYFSKELRTVMPQGICMEERPQ
jgi:UDP-N-acetylglucosamine:LPS N-acetylglucosamine transferase